MSEFVIHGVPGSPYVRAVLLGLEEKRAPWRIAAMRPGENKAPAHLARHPFGRLPVLDDGDFQLYETQAILRYLDRILPQPHLTPDDARAEARMNQVIGITDCYVMPDCSAGIVFGRIVAPKFGLPVDEARIAASVPKATVCLATLEGLLGGQDFMAGSALSLADLMLAPHLSYLAMTLEGTTLLAERPGLSAWLARMEARPSMTATRWEAVSARAA